MDRLLISVNGKKNNKMKELTLEGTQLFYLSMIDEIIEVDIKGLKHTLQKRPDIFKEMLMCIIDGEYRGKLYLGQL